MSREDWKQGLSLSLMLILITLLIGIVRLKAQLTPSQVNALANIHMLVNVALLLTAIFTAFSFVRWKRQRAAAGIESDIAADTDAGPEAEREAKTDAEPEVEPVARIDPSFDPIVDPVIDPRIDPVIEPVPVVAEPPPPVPEVKELTPAERWLELLKSDADIRSAAEHLSAYGIKWVTALGRDFLAVGVDKAQLTNIVRRLQLEAAEERRLEEDERWGAQFSPTAEGERITPEAIAVLRQAILAGYSVTVDSDRVIVVGNEAATSYLQSVSDIMHFRKNRLPASNEKSARRR